MSEHFTGRREDRRLITGTGRYTADWNEPGQLYAVFLRSDRAHAKILSIDTQAAQAMPGVRAVMTSADADIAAMKNPPSNVTWEGRGGTKMNQPDRPVMARGKVLHVGEPVAMVVADSVAAAQDATEAIVVDYEDLKAVIDLADALAPGAPQLHDTVPGNLPFDYEWGDEAKVTEIFSKAAHVVSLSHEDQRLVGNPMEPKAFLAVYDATKDVYDVWSSTQGMTMMKGSLAATTGVPPQKFRVHTQDVGGGFGIRSNAYPEYCVVVAAAKRTGKPVKWVATRTECFVSDWHGRDFSMKGELAFDAGGKILAARYDWIAAMGAYCSPTGPNVHTLTPATTSVGTYAMPAVYGRIRCALTNTTSITAYRGAGRPDIAYMLERLVDEAALKLKIDPIELRKKNFISKEAFPYTTPNKVTYDSGDYAGMLDDVIKVSDWNSFEARRAESKARGKLRGRGLAVFVEPSGGGRGPDANQAMIKFGSSGNIDLFSISGPSGQGHETVFPEIVGRELGIDPSLITARIGDPDGPPLTGLGTIGSRSMIHHGSASMIAAREVIKKGMDLAAKDLEVATQDLEYAGGSYRVKGTDRSISLVNLAKKLGGTAGVHPLDASGGMAHTSAFPSGAHVAEVEIDPATGVTEVLRYCAVDDCGNIVNHTLLEGQMHGGIMQGAGQVFGEHGMYDRETGQLLTGSFMDYYMPKAGLIRDIYLGDHPSPSPTNPMGVKGAGEAGTTGALPTLMNAIHDALRPAGVPHLDMPATPSRVWEALRAARKAA